MQTAPPKKMLIMNILDILRKYSDEEHQLSQKDIVEILKNEYNMSADRKAVRRNLSVLLECGFDINYSETVRMVPIKDKTTGEVRMEENIILSDFYLVHEFTDSELRLLIDGLLFSKHIPYSQCKELVGKLENLSNRYFKARVKHIRTLPDTVPQNRQLFYTIEILDEAISKGRQVAFTYNRYGTDKKLHPEKTAAGAVREYIINPYQIVAANGRYYLICNYDKYDDVAHFRLDRITEIRLLDIPVKPMKQVEGLKNGLNLPKHMAEHVYMFSGESVPVTFRAKKYILNDIIDWFGKEVTFSDESDDEVIVRVTVNREAMRHWALQYALHTKILSPKKLADEIKADLQSAVKNYKI